MPKFTAHCSTAAIQGRHFFGQVSESSEAPTAHSPPIPSAARNRKIISCHQVLREERKAREKRVGEDRQDQRAAAAEAVADDAEERAAEGPPEEEGRLDPRTVKRHGRVGLRDEEQLRHEDRGDERVEVKVESVEEPTQPGGEAGLLLMGGQLAELRGFGGGLAHGTDS
jgi:hypothetical protein